MCGVEWTVECLLRGRCVASNRRDETPGRHATEVEQVPRAHRGHVADPRIERMTFGHPRATLRR